MEQPPLSHALSGKNRGESMREELFTRGPVDVHLLTSMLEVVLDTFNLLL